MNLCRYGKFGNVQKLIHILSLTFYIAHPRNKSNFLDKVKNKNKAMRDVALASEKFPYFDAGKGEGATAGTIAFGGGEILDGAYRDSTGKSPVTFD